MGVCIESRLRDKSASITFYAITAPIIKPLNRDQNVHAIKGYTRRLIPQTGFNAHPSGQFVLDKVKEGDFQAALDKMAKWRTHFDVKGMWALQDQRRVSKQCNSALSMLNKVVGLQQVVVSL